MIIQTAAAGEMPLLSKRNIIGNIDSGSNEERTKGLDDSYFRKILPRILLAGLWRGPASPLSVIGEAGTTMPLSLSGNGPWDSEK